MCRGQSSLRSRYSAALPPPRASRNTFCGVLCRLLPQGLCTSDSLYLAISAPTHLEVCLHLVFWLSAKMSPHERGFLCPSCLQHLLLTPPRNAYCISPLSFLPLVSCPSPLIYFFTGFHTICFCHYTLSSVRPGAFPTLLATSSWQLETDHSGDMYIQKWAKCQTQSFSSRRTHSRSCNTRWKRDHRSPPRP